MITCAWMWVYLGLALMLMELAAPGFVLFFFGLSAVTVGGLRFALGETLTLTWQLAAFSAFSILYIVTLRRFLKRVFVGDMVKTATDFDNESVGRIGTVTEPIAPPMPGRIMLGDAAWTATADAAIPAGANVRVIAQDNLTMKVEAV